MKFPTTTPAGLPIIDGPMVFGLRPIPGLDRVIDLSTIPYLRAHDPAPWKPRYPTLLCVFSAYIREHAIKNTADANRAAQCLLEWVGILGPDFDCRTVTRNDGRRVIVALEARGLAPGSIRRCSST